MPTEETPCELDRCEVEPAPDVPEALVRRDFDEYEVAPPLEPSTASHATLLVTLRLEPSPAAAVATPAYTSYAGEAAARTVTYPYSNPALPPLPRSPAPPPPPPPRPFLTTALS